MLNAEVMALTSDMTCKRKNVKRGDQEKDAPPTPLKRKCMFEYCGCCGCGCTWEKVINPIIEVAWIAEGSGANIILFSRPQKMFFFIIVICTTSSSSLSFYIWCHILEKCSPSAFPGVSREENAGGAQ